jgi:hypothetical protein
MSQTNPYSQIMLFNKEVNKYNIIVMYSVSQKYTATYLYYYNLSTYRTSN